MRMIGLVVVNRKRDELNAAKHTHYVESINTIQKTEAHNGRIIHTNREKRRSNCDASVTSRHQRH